MNDPQHHSRRSNGPLLRTLAGGLAVAVLLLLWPVPEMSRAFRYGMDLLHAPFFTILAFGFDRKRIEYQQTTALDYRIVFWIVLMLLGGSLEIAQAWVGRDSNWHDGLANLMGITAGMLFSASYDAQMTPRKWLQATIGLLLNLGASFYGIRGLWDTIAARRDFPMLANFESSTEWMRWHARDAQLTSSRQNTTLGKQSGKLELGIGRYPGASLELPPNNWSPYQTLAFDIIWEPRKGRAHTEKHGNPVTLPLQIKLEDQGPNDAFENRFESTILLSPGKNRVRIPLEKIRNGPVDRPLRLDDMFRFSLFTVNLQNPETLFLDQMRLE